MSIKDIQLDPNRIPKHVAIIMDGNGRWAQKKGELRIFGHTNGVDSVREALTAAVEIGVQYLTLYAFSTENWNRPQEEIAALMDLLVQSIYNEIDELNNKGVKLETIGDVEILPKSCQNALVDAKKKTKDNQKITLILVAFSGWIFPCVFTPSVNKIITLLGASLSRNLFTAVANPMPMAVPCSTTPCSTDSINSISISLSDVRGH